MQFALTALDPNAQAVKAAAAQSGRRVTARASEALGLKLFRARKDAVLQNPASSLAARARAWAVYALSPLLGVPRALRFSLRTAMAHPGDAFAVLPVELFVGNVTPQHAVVLNKFPVLPEHCVIVTRAFHRQDEPLTREDMRALWLWCVLGGLPAGWGGRAGGVVRAMQSAGRGCRGLRSTVRRPICAHPPLAAPLYSLHLPTRPVSPRIPPALQRARPARPRLLQLRHRCGGEPAP